MGSGHPVETTAVDYEVNDSVYPVAQFKIAEDEWFTVAHFMGGRHAGR
jgi:hypothetical protein